MEMIRSRIYGCFNPRTHEECDIAQSTMETISFQFQSTHSRGVRPLVKNQDPRAKVSIHALTRSATFGEIDWTVPCGFQSTHSRGVRLWGIVLAVPFVLFQSTHSRGVRRYHPMLLSPVSCFNPRTHEECDTIC